MRMSDCIADVCSSDLPPVLQRCDRSEALFVTGIRLTAVDVVQEEVERTAIEIDQLWHLVGDVVDADRELRVPRQLHAGLQVMREPAVGGARAGAVGADVPGDVAHAPVAAATLLVQRCSGGRETLQPRLVPANVDRALMFPARMHSVVEL